MRNLATKQAYMYLLIEELLYAHRFRLYLIIILIILTRKMSRKCKARPYGMISKIPDQVNHLNRMLRTSDVACILNLRMDRNAFGRLCILLKDLGGLSDGRYLTVEEQVAIFLSILAHHKKNRVVGFNFQRSGQTISYYMHLVLRAVIKLHGFFLVNPTPVGDDCTDTRWNSFKGCLGALDGTYITVMVRTKDKPRYRTRKGQICSNVLAACDRNMKFICVLPGWEGSAADGRVLRDVFSRPHGLRVPRGKLTYDFP